uniref:Uncharacterized protein n=1 Tax=Rhizophora mucronata TaxID=61149 RepID=A0A2P2R217_RHIMU
MPIIIITIFITTINMGAAGNREKRWTTSPE